MKVAKKEQNLDGHSLNLGTFLTQNKIPTHVFKILFFQILN